VPRRRRVWRLVVLFVVVVVGVVVVPLPHAPTLPAHAGTVAHRPPVPGPVVSPFDLPEQPWQPGNRGIDYDPPPGTPVVASADGEVVFAGPVGKDLHVTVRHADGLRTSYSFLAEVAVGVGGRVAAGDVVGVAGGPVHFGVRDPEGNYLDPELLLAGVLARRPILVPGTGEGADPLIERRHLLEVAFGTGVAAVAAAGEAFADIPTMADATLWLTEVGYDYVEHRLECTPGSVPPPTVSERRILVVVSGLGTGSDSNSAFDLPTDELGYAATDVVRYSYAGGRAPDPGHPHRPGDGGLGGIDVRPFDGLDSQQPLEQSADRLAEVLGEVARRDPGVPIDVIAHSQGGVVARLALDRAATRATLPHEVTNLVTLGSPHQGADLAEAVMGVQDTLVGDAILQGAVDGGVMAPLDPRRPAITQLAPTGPTLAAVRDQPLPDHVRFTSVGVRYDLTVPAGRTDDGAAHHVVVDPGLSFDAHGAVTTSPAALREVRLALAGAAPTCEAFGAHLLDRAAPEVISRTQQAGGRLAAAALGMGG
jgi:hypothetical protein